MPSLAVALTVPDPVLFGQVMLIVFVVDEPVHAAGMVQVKV